MGRWIAIALALAACSKKNAEGLKPAQDWSADEPGVQAPQQPPSDPHAANPHGGMGMPAAAGGDDDPHAGVDMTNPHAGVDMTNPHGGAGGTDVTQLGLQPPDPDRKLDPNHHIRGVIAVDSKAKDHVSTGGVVFVVAKHADASGQPIDPPLAVIKVIYDGKDIPFELSDANQMIANTSLDGDVIVSAHYDQDGEARSKQSGDVLGKLRVKVPADNVKVLLDTIVP